MTPALDWDSLGENAGVELDRETLAQLRAFAGLLLRANQRMNLTRITGEPELLEKHLLDALVGAPLLAGPRGAPPETLVDVGSGGGVPGLPLAILWSGCRVLLVDAEARKVEYLRDAVRALGLTSRVEAVQARAEVLGRDPARREAFEAATLRAVGPVSTCLELGLPLVRPGGRLLLYRGPGEAEAEERAVERVSPLLGGGAPRGQEIVLPSQARRRLIRVEKLTSTPEAYPRRDGVPARRPLEG